MQATRNLALAKALLPTREFRGAAEVVKGALRSGRAAEPGEGKGQRFTLALRACRGCCRRRLAFSNGHAGRRGQRRDLDAWSRPSSRRGERRFSFTSVSRARGRPSHTLPRRNEALKRAAEEAAQSNKCALAFHGRLIWEPRHFTCDACHGRAQQLTVFTAPTEEDRRA
ncbi:hypothetical protein MTO96_001360 [Rhipicephalus appendiculatus]